MKPSAEEFKLRMIHFRNVLKQSGVKLTHHRIEVYKEVMSSEDHPDAETIFKNVRKRMPTISLDTVYRTLWMLLDLGIIDTLCSVRDRVRFDGNIDSHHHFICTKCGMAQDFHLDGFDTLPIPDVVTAVGEVKKTSVEFRGICNHCAEDIKLAPRKSNTSAL